MNKLTTCCLLALASLVLLQAPAFTGWVSDVDRVMVHGQKGRIYVNGKKTVNPGPGGFVADTAMITGDAVYIGPEAFVLDNAALEGHACIYGRAVVRGGARVQDRARVSGNAVVEGDALVGESAVIGGSAHVGGMATVMGTARILDDALVGGTVVVKGNAVVRGGTELTDGEISSGLKKDSATGAHAEQLKKPREAEVVERVWGESALIGFPFNWYWLLIVKMAGGASNFTKILEEEWVKVVMPLINTLVAIVLGLFLSQKITMEWNFKQKQREADLASAQQFHRLYGEFFSTWKLWDNSRSNKESDGLSRVELMDRASRAEGCVESLLVMLASSRELTKKEREILGAFRQAYQQLRKAIVMNECLDWFSSEHCEYLAFKKLSMFVATLIAKGVAKKNPSNASSVEAIIEITGNKFERDWVVTALAIPDCEFFNGKCVMGECA